LHLTYIYYEVVLSLIDLELPTNTKIPLHIAISKTKVGILF